MNNRQPFLSPLRIAALLLLVSSTGLAQRDTVSRPPRTPLFNTPATLFGKSFTVRADLLTPGFQAEWQVSPTQPISLVATLGLSSPAAHVTWVTATIARRYEFYQTTFGSYLVQPRLRLEGRYYYSRDRRLSKSKSVDFFSGSYVGASYSIGYEAHVESVWDFRLQESRLRPNWDVGMINNQFAVYWGFQRHFGENKRWFFDAQVGVAYLISHDRYFDYRSQSYKFEYYNRVPYPLPQLRAGLGLRLR